jgi:hypothetical protein
VINFSGTATVFRWTKPRNEKALTLLDDPANCPDSITSQLASTLHKLSNFRPEPHPECELGSSNNFSISESLIEG